MPDYTKNLTAILTAPGEKNISEVWVNGGHMFACAVGSFCAAVATGFFSSQIAANFSHTLRTRLFDKIESFSDAEINRFTVAQSMSSFQQASAASKRVFNLLEQDELIDESNKTTVLENIKGDVIFDNVHFGYSKEKEIIHGFNANIKRGQKIAIVGPTGAGKTTIVNLLMRFYEIDSGDIKIDGTSIKDITRENVHDLFDMILQDTWLFEGTIKENLIFNCQNISDEVVNKAIEAVGLSHFISTLPEGIDTKLSDSLNLSEGQKQQLTIARAMVKDSPLLILDEATSSVDTRTEIIIQNAMDELTKGRTSFIIAHRLSTIKNADVILVVNNGDIIEQGNHESLLKKKGFYADIYNSQFVTM